jgi:Domain of unknown function (DUF5666)
MTSKLRRVAFVAGVIAMLSISAFAGKKTSTKQHVAVGTITSIDANQVVVNEKVKGKEQPMTFQLNSSTQKSGNLKDGTVVTVEYHSESNQNVATAVRERSAGLTEKKPSKKK